MKSVFKKIAIGFVIVLLLILVYGWMNYAPDQSFETIKEKYAYDNSQFLEMEGMPVHYRINGSGEPLVLIHGTGASLHTWEPWTKTLEKDFQIISLDMPAFGITGPNQTGEYSLEYYAKFLNRFLDKIGIEKFSIAGNSLGGGIAWQYAVLFPERVKNLILIDASGYPRNQDLPLAFKLAKNKNLSKILTTLTPKSLFYKSMKEVFHDDKLVTDALVNRYYDMYLRAGNRQAFVDRAQSSERVDAAQIATIKIPTLIMWGDKDEWIALENAYKFEKDIEDSELIIYENVGHVPMEESPEKTSEDARNFLKKNSAKKIQAEPENVEAIQ